MDIFRILTDAMAPPTSGPIPGAMGLILAKLGIYEIGPRRPSGIPVSVLQGCRPEVVPMPGMTWPAVTREGKPIYSKTRFGKPYRVMDNYGVSKRQWKQMQQDQKRKAAGRWYSGKKAA